MSSDPAANLAAKYSSEFEKLSQKVAEAVLAVFRG